MGLSPRFRYAFPWGASMIPSIFAVLGEEDLFCDHVAEDVGAGFYVHLPAALHVPVYG